MEKICRPGPFRMTWPKYHWRATAWEYYWPNTRQQHPFNAILEDEVTDVANKGQLSLTIHFVDIDSIIQQEFLGFPSLERITGDAIPSAILDNYQNGTEHSELKKAGIQ